MSQDIRNENIIPRFNLAHERPGKTSPEYTVPWGYHVPPLKSFGNVTYLQFTSVVMRLWEKAHPELKVVPYGSREKFDPEVGYIVYSLENKKPSDSNLKPRFREDTVHMDTGDIEGAVFTQSFDHLIQFTAIHVDPVVADEIIALFEDFIMIISPELGMVGVEKLFYNRRVADRDESRFGQDVASRAVQYMVTLQRLIIIRTEILQSIRIDVRQFLESATPGSYSIMFADITNS